MLDTRTGQSLRTRLMLDVALELHLASGVVQAKGTTEAVFARCNALSSPTPPTPDEEAKAPILGRWQQVRLEANGKSSDLTTAKKSFLAIFDDGRYYEGKGEYFGSVGRHRYQLHPNNRVHTIRVVSNDGMIAFTYPGIYRVEGDTVFNLHQLSLASSSQGI